MTDHDALYRSILADPESDTPRLVYADWLEENQRTEEAEFIRVQCRLESLPPDAPDYPALLQRQEELRICLKAHAPGPELHFSAGLSVDSGPAWWAWTQRGFPRFLEFDGLNRRGLRIMRQLARAIETAFSRLPTRWLVLRYVTVEQLAELLQHPVIAHLDQLTVQLYGTTEMGESVVRVIAQCPHLSNLRGLSLAFQLSDAAAERLARSPYLGRLRWLSLEPSPTLLTPLGIRTLTGAGWFRELQELSLHDRFSDDSFQELCRSRPFPNLHTLNLTDNVFSLASWQCFAQSRSFPALRRIDLSRSDLSEGRGAALAEARELQLAALDLSACAIGNAGAEALVTAPWIETLLRLNLRQNDLGPRAVVAIGSCRRFTRLKHLDLSFCQPGVRGLQAIAANPALRGLTALHLYCNPEQNPGLTPEHLQRFLARLDLPHLRHLSLSGRPVGSAVAELTAPKFATLTRLELADCQLTNAGVHALLTTPTLQNLIELDLTGNRLTTGLKPLVDAATLPQLVRCLVSGRYLPAELSRRIMNRFEILL
jgi:uncharacterized protein (TIGR02996 family)